MTQDPTKSPAVSEREATPGHPCWGIFATSPNKRSHRHWFANGKLMPTCERCGTEIDREHKEVGPVCWTPPVRLASSAVSEIARIIDPEAFKSVADYVETLIASMPKSMRIAGMGEASQRLAEDNYAAKKWMRDAAITKADAILARLAPAPEKGVREALESALRALAMDSTPIIRRLARIQIKEARAALAQPGAARVGDATVDFVREWLMSGDEEVSQWERDFAAAIDARLASAPQNANETGQDEASGWRAMADTIKAEIDRQCGIGAGMAATCPETGLFQVSADLDIATLARAALATQPAALTIAIDRDNLAVAIAECFLCQPKEMAWEDRTDELAGAVIDFLVPRGSATQPAAGSEG